MSFSLKMITGAFAACFILPALQSANLPELYFNPPPREIRIGHEMSDVVKNGRSELEIVAPKAAGGVVKYSAEELQKFLQQSTGAEIPVVEKRSGAKYAVILGDTPEFRKAFPKIDPAEITLDGFYTLRKGNDIFIVGRDDKGNKMQDFLKVISGSWWGHTFFERGTLFGVYDFLERFAGVRFFFDGDIGTVVPKNPTLKIPVSLHIFDRPDFTSRKTSWYVGRRVKDEWYNDDDPVYASNRNYLRWRLETRSIPNCHGLAQLALQHRFAKSKPEMFAMWENGKRSPGKVANHGAQLCMSSKVMRDEVYKDVKSFLTGESAKVRGVSLNGRDIYWPGAGFQPGFANVMPQDAFFKCRCADCRKYFDKGSVASSNLIWEMTADIANRAKKDNLPGYITQMAYHFYKVIPETEIPDNVLVMVAQPGPWRDGKSFQASDDKNLRDWVVKAKRKIAFWNYCINNSKWGERYGIEGMPHTTPRAIAKYYQRHKDIFYGGFLECEAKHFIWGVPNIYVATRMFWNAGQDIEALLKDFYSKLFGAAAPDMEEFFTAVEEKWIRNRKEVDTPMGPQAIPVTKYAVWTQIYPPKEVKRLAALFDRAEAKVKNDSDSLKRVKFFREKFLNVIEKHSAEYIKQQNAGKEVVLPVQKRTPVALDKPIRVAGKTAYLRSVKSPVTDVQTTVIAQKNNENLYFIIRCEDHEMNKLQISSGDAVKKNFWREALVELFLNPSCDRLTYYHIAVHPSGVFEATAHPERKPWKGKVKVKTVKGSDFWAAEVTIPLKELGKMEKEFPFNVAYNRQLVNEDPYSRTFSWSPFIIDNFHAIDRFGVLVIDPEWKDTNIIKDWNFEAELAEDRIGAWFARYPADPEFVGAIEPDFSTFITGGQSLHLKMEKGKSVAASQNFKLKPGTEYTFSYWIKNDIAPSSGVNAVVNVGRNIFMPELQIRGKAEWHKRSYTFKTPENFNENANVRFVILRPNAEIWIDNVRLEEKK